VEGIAVMLSKPPVRKSKTQKRTVRLGQLVSLFLTSLNRRSENVRILPIVIPKLELGNIEGHVFPADFVERADDPALEDAPEPLNRIRVNRADHVLPSRVG
jgi:hypothetical protein